MYVKNIRHQKNIKKIVVTDRNLKLTLKSHIFSFYTLLKKNIMNDNIQKRTQVTLNINITIIVYQETVN